METWLVDTCPDYQGYWYTYCYWQTGAYKTPVVTYLCSFCCQVVNSINMPIWLSTLVVVWRGNIPGKPYGEFLGCSLKTLNFPGLWLTGAIPPHWRPSQPVSRGPVDPLVHRTIVSPPIFPDPDSHVCGDFTMSPEVAVAAVCNGKF